MNKRIVKVAEHAVGSCKRCVFNESKFWKAEGICRGKKFMIKVGMGKCCEDQCIFIKEEVWN